MKRSSVAVKGRPHSIEVIEEGGERFLEAIVRGRLDRAQTCRSERAAEEKPRKPIARARTEVLDKTRRKQI